MSEPADETFIPIEETQTALRDCIEKAKELATKSERLIRQHRDEVIAATPPSRAQ